MAKEHPHFSHIAQNVGEDYLDYLTRIICSWARTGGKPDQDKVRHVLSHLQLQAYEEGHFNGPKEAERRLKETAAGLRSRIEDLQAIVSAGVSRIDAEEGRRKAAFGMREKAAILMEGVFGCIEGREGSLNNMSEAIRDLPLPKPYFTATRRPGDTIT